MERAFVILVVLKLNAKVRLVWTLLLRREKAEIVPEDFCCIWRGLTECKILEGREIEIGIYVRETLVNWRE